MPPRNTNASATWLFLLLWGLCLGGLFALPPACLPNQLREKQTGPDTNEATETKPNQDTNTPEITPTKGIWGALAPIDIHAHIGSFSGYDLSTPTLMANIRAYGIRWALISNIDGANISSTKNISEEKANQATVDTVKAYPTSLRGIYWTRPNKGLSAKAESFLQTTLGATKQRIFVGMKFHPNMNQFAADGVGLDPYMALCQKYKLVAVFHSGATGTNASVKKIYALARRYPKVPVVLYHMGFFGPHTDAIDVVKQAIQKQDAKLYLGTAQADPKAVVKAVNTLGSEWVMFGTDAAYYGKQHYASYKAMVQTLQSELSAKALANVLRNNARALFQLP